MLIEIKKRIEEACFRVGRKPEEVKLIAVSKGHSVPDIEHHILKHGHLILGESRVQEWQKKAAVLENIEWHFIGNLQRNKVKYCLGFHLIHSLNSKRLADTLEKVGCKHNHHFQVLIEVNTSNEASKQGVALSEAEALVSYTNSLSHVQVKGLMTMAPFTEDIAAIRKYFISLKILRDKLKLVELSMGMSRDFEIAIEEGATIVRVGSAIFKS